MTRVVRVPEAAESLDIPRDTLAFLIVEARAFDAQVPMLEPTEETSSSDDGEVGIVEARSDDPTAAELGAAIDALSDEEQIALVALAWVGRGDYDASEWDEAKRMARQRRVGPTRRYLLSIPLLGDYLEEGAAAMGVNLTEDEANA